jgi:hypothetical protein
MTTKLTLMERRYFIQNGSMAATGVFATPSVFGGSIDSPNENQEIKKVLLVFKTHLDVGFTNMAATVIKTYLEEFIPGALTLAENQRTKNPGNRYVWTTGSWLINQVLKKTDPAKRKRMEKAIENRDILWHVLPYTMHSELVDPSLYDLGIQLSINLDPPLVAPGEGTLLNFDNRLPEVKDGIHFCLHNNVWGTNFRMWFEDDMKYRFVFKA